MRLLRKIKQQLIILLDIPNQIMIFLIWKSKRFQLQESIIIFSETRGGSTWLMSILSNIPNTCINWEPLHKKRGVSPKKYAFGDRPLISQYTKNKNYHHLFKTILSFKSSSIWTRKHLTISSIFSSEIVITKFVRANLLAPYLLETFNFKKKPIFLIRHPIDICMSQNKTNFSESFQNRFKEKNIPNDINKTRFEKHFAFLNKLDTDLEIRIALWCINNISTINNSDIFSKMFVVYYYDLILNPKSQLEKIYKNLGIEEVLYKNFNFIDFKKPSSTARANQSYDDAKYQLKKNIKTLSPLQKDNIQKVFDYFNFKLFDAYSAEPKKQHLTKTNL
tara:strand:+ start:269 stop:1270 length:1002 start_codon:yes stop_codon:yes gene_type:complete